MLFYDMFDKPRHIPLLTRCEAMMGPGRAVGLSMAAQVFPAEISMEYCARPEDIDYFFALLRVHPLTLKPEAQATAGDRAVMHGITFSAQDGGLDGLRKALNSAIAIRDSARTREPYKPTLSQSIYNAIGPCRGE